MHADTGGADADFTPRGDFGRKKTVDIPQPEEPATFDGHVREEASSIDPSSDVIKKLSRVDELGKGE
jgi:hypothetical protein